MSGRRQRYDAVLAGPLLLILACLFAGFPSEAGARARVQEKDEGRDSGAAETRRPRGDDAASEQDRRDRDRDARPLLDDEDAVDGARIPDRDRPRDRGRARARRPMNDDDDRPARDDDDRPARDDDDDDRRREPREREWFRDPGYYGYGNFPTAEVQDAVVANARAAHARALFRRAENALNASIRGAVRTWTDSSDLREARQAEKKSYAAYTLARRRALQTVLEDPKYRAIMSLRQDLSDQINNKRAGRSVDDRTDSQVMGDIVTIAKLKMDYAAEARSMEEVVLETDATTKAAQAKLRAAGTRLAEMKREFDDALRNDPDLLAARENLEDARIARLTASAYLKGASVAAREALDFAYYLNRYHRYSGSGYQHYGDDYLYRFSYRGGRY